jgi:hypothetical protein
MHIPTHRNKGVIITCSIGGIICHEVSGDASYLVWRVMRTPGSGTMENFLQFSKYRSTLPLPFLNHTNEVRCEVRQEHEMRSVARSDSTHTYINEVLSVSVSEDLAIRVELLTSVTASSDCCVDMSLLGMAKLVVWE